LSFHKAAGLTLTRNTCGQDNTPGGMYVLMIPCNYCLLSLVGFRSFVLMVCAATSGKAYHDLHASTGILLVFALVKTFSYWGHLNPT
jgi:hypothetical protein